MKAFTSPTKVILGAATVGTTVLLVKKTYFLMLAREPSIFWMHWIPAALLFATSLAGMRSSALTRLKICVAAFSTLLSLYAVEGVLRLTKPEHSASKLYANRALAAKALGVAFDTRTPREITKALRREGKNVWAHGLGRLPVAGEGERTYHPLGNIPNALIVYCNEGGDYVLYQSDEHGFRNPPGSHAVPADVALIGDSFTHGACVPEEESLAGRFREKFPKTLNLGWGGTGPLWQLAISRELLEPRPPKVLLWFYFEGNDAEDAERERTSPILLRYLDDPEYRPLARVESGEQLRAKVKLAESQLDNMVTLLAGAEKTEPGFFSLLEIRSRMGLLPKFDSSKMPPEFPQVLQRLVSGFPRTAIYLVYLPTFETIASGHRFHPNEARELRGAAERYGIRFVDVTPEFLSHPDPLGLFPLRIAGLYNREGYALVADRVLNELAKDGVPR